MDKQTQEALKMAIDHIEFEGVRNEEGLYVLNACKEALEQPAEKPIDYKEIAIKISEDYKFEWKEQAQEPVAFITERYDIHYTLAGKGLPVGTKLYTHHHQCQECENLKHDLEGYMEANKELLNKQWQGLTDDEIKALDLDNDVISVISQVEQALKEKNT